MKSLALILMASLLVFMPAASFSAASFEDIKSGREVQARVKARYVGDDLYSSTEITLTNRSGAFRNRALNRFTKDYNGLKKTIIRITAPPDIRLTGLLILEEPNSPDLQVLYVPAMKKTRRISTKDRDQSFVGSDFTLYDMGYIEMDDFDYSDTTTEFIDGRECWRYTCALKPGSDAPYGKVEAWVDKEYVIRTKMVYYDKKAGKLLKTFMAKEITLVQGIWTPHYLIMENYPDNHKTEFRMKVTYNVGVPDELFNMATLEICRDVEFVGDR